MDRPAILLITLLLGGCCDDDECRQPRSIYDDCVSQLNARHVREINGMQASTYCRLVQRRYE